MRENQHTTFSLIFEYMYSFPLRTEAGHGMRLSAQGPLLSTFGATDTVKARFWPWLEPFFGWSQFWGQCPYNVSSCSPLDRRMVLGGSRSRLPCRGQY